MTGGPMVYIAVLVFAIALTNLPRVVCKDDQGDGKSKMSMNIQVADGMAVSKLDQAPNVLIDATGLALQHQLSQPTKDIEELSYDPFLTNPDGKLRPMLWDTEGDLDLYREDAGIDAVRGRPLVRKKRCGRDDDDVESSWSRVRSNRRRVDQKRVKRIKRVRRRKANKAKRGKKARTAKKVVTTYTIDASSGEHLIDGDVGGDQSFKSSSGKLVETRRTIIKDGKAIQTTVHHSREEEV